MIADEFAAAAIALLGSAVGWQSAIARRIRGTSNAPINPRTIRRWMADGQTPPWVDGWFRDQVGGTAPSPFPRDEWVVGDGVTGDGRQREYVVHLAHPRFVARIVACDDDGFPLPTEAPADILTGIVYAADAHTLLCEIEWFDDLPAGQVTHLLEAAANAIDELA